MNVNSVQKTWQQKEKIAGYKEKSRPILVPGVKIIDFEIVSLGSIQTYTPKSAQSRVSDKSNDNLRSLESSIEIKGIKKPIASVIDPADSKKRKLELGHHRLEVAKTLCNKSNGFVKRDGTGHKWHGDIPSYIVEFADNKSKLLFRAANNAHDPAESHNEADGIKFLNDMADAFYFKGDSDDQKRKKAQDLLSEYYAHLRSQTRKGMVTKWINGGKPASMRTYRASSCNTYCDENALFTIPKPKSGNVRHSKSANRIEHVVQYGAVWQGVGSIAGKLSNYYWCQIADGKSEFEVKKEIRKTEVVMSVHVPAKSANTPANLEDARKDVIKEIRNLNLTNGLFLPATVSKLIFVPQDLTSGQEEISPIVMIWNTAKKDFEER